MVPSLISGGLGTSLLPPDPPEEAVAAAYLASSLYFSIVAKKSPMSEFSRSSNGTSSKAGSAIISATEGSIYSYSAVVSLLCDAKAS